MAEDTSFRTLVLGLLFVIPAVLLVLNALFVDNVILVIVALTLVGFGVLVVAGAEGVRT